jgi:Protein of unknown function (DUF732)
MGDDAPPTQYEPTELAGVAQSAQAWALDDGEEITEYKPRRFTPAIITTAAVVASSTAIALAGVIYGYHIDHETSAPTAESPTPVSLPTSQLLPMSPPPPVTVTAPPVTVTPARSPGGPWGTPTKPATVTVQAPPPTMETAPVPDDGRVLDLRFLALVSQVPGITIVSPVLMTASARQMCIDMQNGVSTPAQEVDITVRNTAGATPAQAAALTAAAVDVYCPNLHPWLQTIGVG